MDVQSFPKQAKKIKTNFLIEKLWLQISEIVKLLKHITSFQK